MEVEQKLEKSGDSYLAYADPFGRIDESDDRIFYERDRFVSHLDAVALSTVEEIIGKLIVEDNPHILDLMASWDSHLPSGIRPKRMVGLGLNENELKRNPRLTEVVLHDLNRNPILPFEAASFDVVLNTVSVDYLTRPFEIFAQVGRILKPGGLYLVIFSNRMFPEKATQIWRDATERERIELVRLFFHRTGLFEEPKVFVSSGKPRPQEDKYAYLGIPSDPVYAVYADKHGDRAARKERPPLIPPDTMSPPVLSRDIDKDAVRRTLLCPHCGVKMKKWAAPNNPFSNWDTEFLYICFNDDCPYLVKGWQVMAAQGNQGRSYRFVYDPVRNSFMPISIVNLHGLREGIVE